MHYLGIRGPAHGGMHGQPLPGLLGALGMSINTPIPHSDPPVNEAIVKGTVARDFRIRLQNFVLADTPCFRLLFRANRTTIQYL